MRRVLGAEDGNGNGDERRPLSARDRLSGDRDFGIAIPPIVPVSAGDTGKPSPGAPPVGTLFGSSPGVLGSFKEGGEVPKDGVYHLEKGEKVTPVGEKGQRDSEYRRVYLARKNKK